MAVSGGDQCLIEAVAFKPSPSFDVNDDSQNKQVSKFDSLLQTGHTNKDTQSQNTQGGVCSISTRAKDDEDDFNLSFDEEFYLDLQKGDILGEE